MAKQLSPGDAFPEYRIQTADGEKLTMPNDLKGDYAVIMFYRGIRSRC